MENIFHYFLPREILYQMFATHLSLQDISHHTAMCDTEKRPIFLHFIRSVVFYWLNDKKKQFGGGEISWLSARNIEISILNCVPHSVAENTARLFTVAQHR